MAGNIDSAFIVYALIIHITSGEPIFARNWETIGPEILKSKIIPPLFNQTSPGCWLGNQFYMVGDRWSPVIEPHGLMACVKCQCAQVVKNHVIQLDGRVVCKNIRRECPAAVCEKPILKPGACCGVCPDEDSSFEDSFHTDRFHKLPDIASTKPEDRDFVIKDMTAVLVGGGRLKHGQRPIRTRAVAMIHLTNITSDSFNYAMRFSRLKSATYFKISDEYGTSILEEKLPRNQPRSGRIYGQVKDIPDNYMEYIKHHHCYVDITTVRHKKGEISGRLSHNSMASVVTFEALLNPSSRSGAGALVTFFYDVTSKMASFVIQMEGLKYSKITTGEYFVTLEKDTEILHQNMLQLSRQKNQLIGKVQVSSRWSKQIARGRMQVRVTSRSGEIMKGPLRPRLLRQDMIGMMNEAGSNVTGYVLLSLLDNGNLRYKVKLNMSQDITMKMTLQRRSKSKDGWKNFCTLLQNSTTDTAQDDLYKKFRARDIVLLLNSDIRVKVALNDRENVYTEVQSLDMRADSLFKDESVILRSTNCDSQAYVFYDVNKDCSKLRYDVISSDYLEQVPAISITLDSVGGRVTRDGNTASGSIGRLGLEMFRDLDEGNLSIHLSLSDGVCDHFRGKILLSNECWVPQSTTESQIGDISNENDLEMDGSSNTFRCYHDGKFYAHAQSWVPVASCVMCTCNRGNVGCDEILCPPLSCAHPVKRESECCRVCVEDNETERKYVGSCYFEGDKRWHEAGTTWYPYVPPFGYSKCAMCTCDPGTLEVNCTRLPCPELTCPKSQRIRLKADDCCQICTDNDVKPSLGIPSVIVKTSPKLIEDCSFGGSTYQHGDKWHPVLHPFGEMKCYTCSCRNGKSRCRKKKCPTLDCRHQYRPSGQCCPICAEKKSKKPKFQMQTENGINR